MKNVWLYIIPVVVFFLSGCFSQFSPKNGVNESCVCIMIYEPVCGVDGKTYSNACFAHCAGVEVKHNGTCEEGKGTLRLISYEPIQCHQNPWNREPYENVPERSSQEREAIIRYYADLCNVTLVNVTFREKNVMTCSACTCPRGDEVLALVNEKDEQKMVNQGWKSNSHTSPSCPLYTPPADTYCPGGALVSDGVDENCCPKPPRCVYG